MQVRLGRLAVNQSRLWSCRSALRCVAQRCLVLGVWFAADGNKEAPQLRLLASYEPCRWLSPGRYESIATSTSRSDVVSDDPEIMARLGYCSVYLLSLLTQG
jgi:hypothetical protein